MLKHNLNSPEGIGKICLKGPSNAEFCGSSKSFGRHLKQGYLENNKNAERMENCIGGNHVLFQDDSM